MVTMKKIRKLYGGKVCRLCINETYNIHLLNTDCIYGMYPAKCAKCGEMKNIVTDFRLSGYLKSMITHSKR